MIHREIWDMKGIWHWFLWKWIFKLYFFKDLVHSMEESIEWNLLSFLLWFKIYIVPVHGYNFICEWCKWNRYPFQPIHNPTFGLFTHPAIMHVFSLHLCYLARANTVPTYWFIVNYVQTTASFITYLFFLTRVPCMDACLFIHIPCMDLASSSS